MYTPRSSNEITRDLIARIVARTTLTDVSEGSVMLALARTFAEQIAESEIRLAQIRDQFSLEGASGADLDERAEELRMTRLPATRATGVVTVARTTSASSLVIPAGSVFGRTDSEITYISTSAVTLGVGVEQADVTIQASVVGSAGNTSSRLINVLSDVPDEITSVTQGIALTNGVDEESDTNLRARATRHLNSLARCQPLALEALALRFSASDNTRATTATLYELPTTRGECELLIDDGSGLGDTVTTRAGALVSVTLNATLGQVIGIEAPVATPPVVLVNGAPLIRGTDYVLQWERGLIHLLEGANVAEGDTLTVGAYQVYQGLVAELQNEIEGDANDITSGHRPAGVSVRVLPAPVQRVDLDLLVVVATNANITTATTTVESVVASYLSALGAGAPAIRASITREVMGVANILNVSILSAGTANESPDIYPATPRTVLRGGVIRVVTSTTTGA